MGDTSQTKVTSTSTMAGHSNAAEVTIVNSRERGHLVLTIALEETIHIGDNVTVKLLDVHKGWQMSQVRFGIEAPETVNVLRSELCEPVDEPEQSN